MPRKKHTVEVTKTELEIKEELDLHERGWKIQKVGWTLIILTMVVGLLGLFGEGILSRQHLQSGNIEAEYDRFFRYESEMKIRIESTNEPIASISIPQQYLKEFRIESFVPEPEKNTATGNDITYSFSSGKNHIVDIYLIPKNFGTINGTMKVNGANQIPLNHFIYP